MKKYFERKFLAMIAGVVINLAGSRLGLTAEQITSVTVIVVGWVLGEATVDAVKTFKNPPVGPNPDDVAAGYADPATPKSKAAPASGSHK